MVLVEKRLRKKLTPIHRTEHVSGAAELPAHGSAPFSELPLIAPFRKFPAPAPLTCCVQEVATIAAVHKTHLIRSDIRRIRPRRRINADKCMLGRISTLAIIQRSRHNGLKLTYMFNKVAYIAY